MRGEGQEEVRMGRKQEELQGWTQFKKEPLGLLKKIIVLFLEALSLFWVVEAFEEIIESTYRILLKRERLIP